MRIEGVKKGVRLGESTCYCSSRVVRSKWYFDVKIQMLLNFLWKPRDSTSCSKLVEGHARVVFFCNLQLYLFICHVCCIHPSCRSRLSMAEASRNKKPSMSARLGKKKGAVSIGGSSIQQRFHGQHRGGCFKYFSLVSPLLGEMIQFDWYCSNGLKPPTGPRRWIWFVIQYGFAMLERYSICKCVGENDLETLDPCG